MRLLDCGCGPGSITADLALAVAPGEAIGVDLREDALEQARAFAAKRSIANLHFQTASVYELPFPDASFDVAFACAVLQHLNDPLVALREMRRVLRPGGVVGIVDGSSTLTFRHPTNALLDKWDDLRAREREHNVGRPADGLRLRELLDQAGFARSSASAEMATEAGAPAGTLEATRRVAQQQLIRLRGVLGALALEQGWATAQELDRIGDALVAWGEAPSAFYARPVFTAIGWA
jgi:SAM-dependent methyltransferase